MGTGSLLDFDNCILAHMASNSGTVQALRMDLRMDIEDSSLVCSDRVSRVVRTGHTGRCC